MGMINDHYSLLPKTGMGGIASCAGDGVRRHDVRDLGWTVYEQHVFPEPHSCERQLWVMACHLSSMVPLFAIACAPAFFKSRFGKGAPVVSVCGTVLCMENHSFLARIPLHDSSCLIGSAVQEAFR